MVAGTHKTFFARLGPGPSCGGFLFPLYLLYISINNHTPLAALRLGGDSTLFSAVSSPREAGITRPPLFQSYFLFVSFSSSMPIVELKPNSLTLYIMGNFARTRDR